MTDLGQAVRQVLDTLTAAGVRCTGDERDLNPPCVFVHPPAIAWRFGRGAYTATFTATAVVPDSGRLAALTNLGALVEAASVALGLATVAAEPADFLTTDHGPLPGYRMTWQARINP